MNGWDLFTWAMAAVLAVGSAAVFAWFLRDVRSLLRERGEPGSAGIAGRLRRRDL